MKTKTRITGQRCPREALLVTAALHEFAETLGAAVDAKDPNTRQHSDEVAQVSRILALEMGFSPTLADIIHVAAHLHDVGKIGIPDSILLKPGPLTPGQWKEMRRHPVMGAEIIQPVCALCACGVFEMVLHHHERFDGKGYPDGLGGENIPVGARIIAVADSLSAMLQARPYRARMTLDEACREIADNSGTQFDPAVVEAFNRCGGEIGRMIVPGRCSSSDRGGSGSSMSGLIDQGKGGTRVA